MIILIVFKELLVVSTPLETWQCYCFFVWLITIFCVGQDCLLCSFPEVDRFNHRRSGAERKEVYPLCPASNLGFLIPDSNNSWRQNLCTYLRSQMSCDSFLSEWPKALQPTWPIFVVFVVVVSDRPHPLPSPKNWNMDGRTTLTLTTALVSISVALVQKCYWPERIKHKDNVTRAVYTTIRVNNTWAPTCLLLEIFA